MVDSTNLPEVDINQIATDLNGKMDKDGVNASCPVVISRTANNQGGIVEIWSDGYCIQTGYNTEVKPVTINLSQAYNSTNYQILTSQGDNTARYQNTCAYSKTTNSFILNFTALDNYSEPIYWRTEGYIR